MPRMIRDAKLRNSRPTRQEHLDRNEEEDKELADEGLFLSEEVLDEEEDEIQRQEDEINVGYLLTCGDCGTTENVGESGFCASCEADFDEILESMNDEEDEDEEP